MNLIISAEKAELASASEISGRKSFFITRLGGTPDMKLMWEAPSKAKTGNNPFWAVSMLSI